MQTVQSRLELQQRVVTDCGFEFRLIILESFLPIIRSNSKRTVLQVQEVAVPLTEHLS